MLQSCKIWGSTISFTLRYIVIQKHFLKYHSPLCASKSFCMIMCYHIYPHAFLKKGRGYCYRLRPSIRPLCDLLLNHWTKFNQIWCVSYSHEWGAQRKKKFGPAPWGPREGLKGQISFNFNYKVNFKDFYSKLCVCSHK